MKKNLIVVILSLFGIINIHSQHQNAYISFDNETHNFGKIKEKEGKVSNRFSFTNTGSKPLIINNVRASCGCTTPKWTRKPVMPGDKGYIDVSFDPRNRPGPFSKSISVTTNAENPNTVLRIKGEVMAREKTLEEKYRYEMGQIRLITNHLAFAHINYGDIQTRKLEFINTSQEPVKVDISRIPSHMKVNITPKEVKSGEVGHIEVEYDAGKKNDWGFVIDRLQVSINGKTEPRNRISVSASIREDFSSLTPEERANAPKIVFEEKTFNFGTMKQNSKVEHRFTFSNQGKRALIIRKVKASCGCTAVSPNKKTIQPGETSSIKTIFSSGRRKGRQQKTITVISNDPDNPSVVLRISGNVEP